MWLWFEIANYKHNTGIDILCIRVKITMEQMPEDPTDGMSTLVQNGLVTSGNKPLTEPVLTNISDPIWCN